MNLSPLKNQCFGINDYDDYSLGFYTCYTPCKFDIYVIMVKKSSESMYIHLKIISPVSFQCSDHLKHVCDSKKPWKIIEIHENTENIDVQLCDLYLCFPKFY